MHVAIVGMGALGRVYGVRLALRAACGVTFVVRPGRTAGRLTLSRVDGDLATDALERPVTDTRVPGGAQAVLVCVRVEQLDAAFDTLIATATPGTPIVALTPVLPRDLERLRRTAGPDLRVAMPGVVAYLTPDGACRYWLPRVAPTVIDATAPVPPAVDELVGSLGAAGFGGRLEPGVEQTNPATTLSFIPLAMGVDAAGAVAPLLADRSLLRLTLDAVAEGRAVATRIGRPAPWVDVLARFAGPTALKIGIGIARSRAPEALAYVDAHFGRKLHAQNVAMARAIVALADDEGLPAPALRALLERLEQAA